MNFQHYEWSRLERGSTVVVTLSVGANVRLMSTSDFNSYRARRAHHYYGGLAKVSPFRIVVPSTGAWHLTVDLAGLRASNVRIGVSVEPSALPVGRSGIDAPLDGIRADPRSLLVPDDNGETWDVFVSHAGEDKASVAAPLGEELKRLGLKVWLDKAQLRIGDSLRRKIDYGLSHSSFGIVILSSSFFAKGWPQYELDGIVANVVEGKQLLLPIWHDITKEEILAVAPSLADKIARSTSTHSIAEIASEIAEVVNDASANDARVSAS